MAKEKIKIGMEVSTPQGRGVVDWISGAGYSLQVKLHESGRREIYNSNEVEVIK